MDEPTATSNIGLRIAGAVILGIFVGFFVFFGISLLLGVFNDTMGTGLTLSMDIAENIFSAVLLTIIIVFFILVFAWLAWRSHPGQWEEEEDKK